MLIDASRNVRRLAGPWHNLRDPARDPLRQEAAQFRQRHDAVAITRKRGVVRIPVQTRDKRIGENALLGLGIPHRELVALRGGQQNHAFIKVAQTL